MPARRLHYFAPEYLQGGITVKKSQLKHPESVKASMPGSEQDPKRRLGNFTSAGEHSRIGGRTSGIVGQTTKKGRTDNRKK